MKQIHAVAFDIDGTLYPNRRMYLASLGFALGHFRLLNAFRKVRKELRDTRPVEDFYELQARLFGRRIGVDTDEAREIINRTFYTRWESVLRKVHLYPGVLDLIRLLKEKHIPLAVMSDFPVVTKMKILNIENYFDVEMSSEEVGYLKPNPEPFLEMARQLDVKPENLLYVGNSFHYDVLGAYSLGMMTAHISSRKPKDSPADFTFKRYSSLRDWILPRLD